MSLLRNPTGNLVESQGSHILSALDRMLPPDAIVLVKCLHLSDQLSCSLVLVLPILLSKDPLLLSSMDVCINVGKYFFHKVPRGFPNSNIYIYIYMFVGCVVLVINKSTTKQNNIRHSTYITLFH